MAFTIEHRGGRRQLSDFAVRFAALPGTIGTGRVTNISSTGAFMETACKLPLLSVVHVEDLDSGRAHHRKGAPKRLTATVVRRCSDGVGLEWCASWQNPPLGPQVDTSPAAVSTATSSAADAGRSWYRLDFLD